MDTAQNSEQPPLHRARFPRRKWPAWIGVLLQAGGGIGLTISLVLFLAILAFCPRLLRNAHGTISSAADQIRSVEDAIDLVTDTLTISGTALEDLSDLLSNADLFLGDTVEVLSNVGIAVGEDASMTIEATHQSVIAAQSGARAIDSTLRALSLVEFITGVSYDPEQSLTGSLEEVAESLEDLPLTLGSIQDSMENSADSLELLRPRVARVSRDLESVSVNVFSAADKVESQREVIQRIANNVETLGQTFERWFWLAVVILAIGAVGMSIVYFGVYILGAELRSSAE